ncbi:MAG: outer membrane protein assembly factor BamA [Deltaproteobacteria bacterium]|nr:MAG: outer membrane protein assembly factor BamA [Deltaproteobacteria bacterium]
MAARARRRCGRSRVVSRPLDAALAVAIGLAAATAPLFAQGEPSITRVAIEGNVRVEEDAIRVHLRTQTGQPFERDTLDRDIRAVYAMGFFDQVDADVSPAGENHVAVTFRVKERALVRTVKVEGTKKLKREEVEGALKVRPHTILDPEKARQGIEAAKKLYVDKGYLDAEIAYRTAPVGENEVDLFYTVKEESPVRVTEVAFEGNRAFSGRKLRRVMQTRKKWLLSIITGAGILNKDVLRTDMERLTAFYYDHGYITVKVDEPRVERRDDGLHVTVKIEEGDQYRVADVTIVGSNVPPDTTRLRRDLATTPGDVFKASALREDVQKLTERLSDDGYAFATVDPDTEMHPEQKTVDIAFQVDRGRQVTVERIEVTGNTKTRDQVLRREMRLQEQELFSATKLRKSREALQRLGFFKEVNITTRRTGADDRMNVVVDVKEGQTGAFSAGAGFSSADSLLFNLRIQENNLFGRGQRLVLNGDVGSLRRNIILSFTEPYFRETPLTVGASAFSWRLQFDEFARGGTGIGTQLTYPVTAWGYTSLWGLPLEEVRVGADYRLEQADINNLGFGATRSIRAEEGTSLISSVTPHVSRNTLNHAFDPTAGSFQEVSLEAAGLGGERFTKIEGRQRWYYTFLRSKSLGDFTYSLGSTVGYGFGSGGLTGTDLPLFERYFPGGISSIRGYKSRTLGPREERKDFFGNVISTTPIGGSEEVVLNNEMIFPLVQGIGLKGVFFVDAGNAYGADEGISLSNTRFSAGAGVRWLSPVGPLRIELGKPFNTKPHDQKSLVLFSFGGPFQY